MTAPGSSADGEGRLLRLECPHCKAETPLWFRPENLEDTLSGTEWELWLDSECRECGRKPREGK